MDLLQLFGKSESKADGSVPFSIDVETHPMRLTSYKVEGMDLEIGLQNTTGSEQQVVSLVITLQKPLGFDQSGLSQSKELRIGAMPADEKLHKKVSIWSNQRTEPGNYRIKVEAIAHYRDYSHVLSQAAKFIQVRVV